MRLIKIRSWFDKVEAIKMLDAGPSLAVNGRFEGFLIFTTVFVLIIYFLKYCHSFNVL